MPGAGVYLKPTASLRFASPWHSQARFGRTARKAYLCISRKRKSAGFSSFCILGANYPIWTEKLSYMTVKIISKPVKICSFIIFTKCFKVKISLIFADFFTEQILLFLIIPKSSCPIALTIANARLTLCAGSEAALTGFVACLATRKHGRRARSKLAACGAWSLRAHGVRARATRACQHLCNL